MNKPLRRVPCCRHYASLVVHLMTAFMFVFACIMAASHQNLQEIPDVIGTALGYFMPCSGFLLIIIIFGEQHWTRFEPQWIRNSWYYHASIPTLYVLALFFLRNDDLMNAMFEPSPEKLSAAYVMVMVPLMAYLYRIFVPFSFISYMKKHSVDLV